MTAIILLAGLTPKPGPSCVNRSKWTAPWNISQGTDLWHQGLLETVGRRSEIRLSTDVNGFEYTVNTLAYFATSEGRVVNNSGTWEYQYNLKEHASEAAQVWAMYE